MALVDDFKERFPEFKSSVVDQYIPVLESVYPCYFGGNYKDPCDKEAILNLLAHLMIGEINTKTQSAKSVNSKSVGSVSVSYSASTDGRAGGEFFRATKYGQRFLMLTQHNVGALFV